MDKQILVPIIAPDWGGLQELACRLAPPLSSRGWHWRVVLPMEAADAEARMLRAGVDVCRMPLHRIRRTTSVRVHGRYVAALVQESLNLARHARTFGPDVVQVSGPHQLQGVIAAAKLRTPLLWQLHSTAAPAWSRRLMSYPITALSDAVMTSGSAYLKSDVRVSSHHKSAFMFFPPVDFHRFMRNATVGLRVRRALDIPEDSCVLVCVGSRTPVKRHDLIVGAASMLSGGERRLDFIIVGSDSPDHRSWYRRDVLEPANSLNSKNSSCRVHIVDGKSDVADWLSAADVFLLPSEAEGAPLAVAEAMASSLPVIATPVGSIPDMVEDGKTGVLIGGAKDVAAVTLAISKYLCLSDSDTNEMSRAAYRAAKKTYSLETCLQVFESAYEYAIT